MKSFTANCLGMLIALGSGTSFAADNQLSSEEKAAGWQLLFDGSDLSQWRNFQKDSLNEGWKAENGALTLSSPGAGDILTKASFDDFDLKLDWKIAKGGNGGIFILVDELGKTIYAHAPEIQILDNEGHSDNKIDSHRSGSLYDMVAAHPSAYKPAGEWNQVRIRLHDKLLQIWQNDVITTSIVIDSSTWNTLLANSKFAQWQGFAENTSGHIGLQDHGAKVWFKNMKIKELN